MTERDGVRDQDLYVSVGDAYRILTDTLCDGCRAEHGCDMCVMRKSMTAIRDAGRSANINDDGAEPVVNEEVIDAERGYKRFEYFCGKCGYWLGHETWDSRRMFGEGFILSNCDHPVYCPMCGTKIGGKWNA